MAEIIEHTAEKIRILQSVKNLVVVGISLRSDRPSNGVSLAMRSRGYNIIPVNPALEVWQGIKCYASISEIPENVDIDMVIIFRRSEFVPEIVAECIKRKDIKYIWMQDGVFNTAAAGLAVENGISVIQNDCVYRQSM